jgi:L-fuculose-phosphate aldolase
MPTLNDREKRQSIIDACLRMSQLGINQGSSGNISLRHDEGMLITPTSVPYETMLPEQIVFMGLDGSFDSRQRPSSEWRFHLDILKARPEVNAVVHAHPPYATTLAIMGLETPPIHYMIAVAGGIPSGARRMRPTAPRNYRSTPSARSKTGWLVFWPIMA